jgi:hypothetical protein
MKQLWQFINMPIIVAIISIAVVIGTLRFGLANLFRPFDSDSKRRDQIEALGRLQLISFAEVDVPTNSLQKFVGEFRNNSQFIIENVEATICFYDKTGKLIDLFSHRLSGTGPIPPDGSAKFYTERGSDRDSFGIPESIKGEGVKTTISFVDLEVTKPSK